jgi:hypothetical protein
MYFRTRVRIPAPPLPNVNERYFFWTGNGDPKTTIADWQRSLRRLLQRATIDGHVHMRHETPASHLLRVTAC